MDNYFRFNSKIDVRIGAVEQTDVPELASFILELLEAATWATKPQENPNHRKFRVRQGGGRVKLGNDMATKL